MEVIPGIGIAVLVLSTICMASHDKKTYIVHMEQFELTQTTLDVEEAQYFESSLKSVSNTAKIIYTYNNVVNGYSASLKAKEAEALKALPQVVSVSAETVYHLDTTRTPAFLGLDQLDPGLPTPHQLSNVIVGVFDSGVWPESKSYSDAGLGPVPSHWRGECETGRNFTVSMCNKKLVGARFFSRGYEAEFGSNIDWSFEYKSPRDGDGHGTHTSTTAAGSPVPNANMFGYANGTSRGMATHARLAMDKAIDDKVDVMSLSISGGVEPYYSDYIAIGAFAVMEKGILVSCSAGNNGPAMSTVGHVSPWITTVGAGTLDRDFHAPVVLGNGNIYYGMSLYKGRSLDGKFLPFVYAGNATNYMDGHFCLPGKLIPDKVGGKIVLCDRGVNDRVEKAGVVKSAGGKGMILANSDVFGEEILADPYLCLGTMVGEKAGKSMKNYISSDCNPTATIRFEGTRLGVQPAPVVAVFSSRGPNALVPNILKPDLIAPGVNILAGWSGDVGPNFPMGGGPEDKKKDMRRIKFNIVSGTSMACPHVSGLAALVKAANPTWSPAAIRSALMTTAYSTYENGKSMLDSATMKPSTPFSHGAGHVKPLAALHPGLVYDLNATDYFNFLCALNYTHAQIKAISRHTKFACEFKKNSYSVTALNYPSFAVIVRANRNEEVSHVRTLTNVGPPGTYMVRVNISPGESVEVHVVPKTLTFTRTNEKKSFKVTFKVKPGMPAGANVFGKMEWYDGKKHVVGSPIAVRWTTS